MNNCSLCQTPLVNSRRSADGKIYFDCACCGLISLKEEFRLSNEQEKRRYLLHQNSTGSSGYQEFLERTIAPLRSNIKPGMSGIDYGCGPGPTISKILNAEGMTVTDYDPYFAPRVFSDSEQFDFITCTETIEHFRNPAVEFEKLSRLVRPSGWVVLMTEILDGDISFENWWYIRDRTHVSLYQPKTMEWIAHKYKWCMQIPSKTVRLYRAA